MKPLTKANGFSLIEVLVALVILSISLLALAGLTATSSRNTSFGDHITEAVTFAQDKIEELRVTSWSAIATGNDTNNGSTGIVYARNWTVPIPAGDLKTITVTVKWSDPVNRSFSFVSTISNPNP